LAQAWPKLCSQKEGSLSLSNRAMEGTPDERFVSRVPSKEFFSKQRDRDPANTVCCDQGGGDGETDWASVSHGIYLSIEAAGAHRSLGVRVSFVQSTSMDVWKPIHLRMMELGGNRTFQEFLDKHGCGGLPIREKYFTRAAKWYRENLRALAEGGPCPDSLPEGTGHLPVDMCDLYPELAREMPESDASFKKLTDLGAKSVKEQFDGEGVAAPDSRCTKACKVVKAFLRGIPTHKQDWEALETERCALAGNHLETAVGETGAHIDSSEEPHLENGGR